MYFRLIHIYTPLKVQNICSLKRSLKIAVSQQKGTLHSTEISDAAIDQAGAWF